MRRMSAPLTLATLAILLSCSKKSSSPPTAPVLNPGCSLSTTTLSFGTVTVGSNADRSFTLTNTGGGTLSGTVTESSAEFAIMGPAGYSLGSGQAATLTVRFSPANAGAKACTLSTGSALCGNVFASGTGLSATPVCFVQTATLDFGTLDYGVTAYRTIAIQNTGGGTLKGSISGATVDFSFLDDPTFSLGAGQWANINLQFSPSSGGAQACTLRVDPPGCSSIVCRGVGSLPTSGDCQVRVTSAAVDFGEVSIGTTAERAFTLKNFDNTYSAHVTVYEICPEFELTGSASFDLSPGVSSLGYVRFMPTRSGPQTCAIPVSCMMIGPATNGGIRDYVICTGTGVGGSPQCQISTTNLSVGTLHSGQIKDTTFTISNAGTGTLSGFIRFLDSNPPPFSIVGPTTYSLGAGQSQSFATRFAAPAVPAGHAYSYARLIDPGTACANVGLVTVQGTALP